MIWYYIDESVTDGERRKGPFNIDEIRDFVKQGTIKDETLVWHSGMEAWVAWKDTAQSKEIPLSEEEQIKQALEAIIAEHNKGKHYAGFMIRGVAYSIDGIILFVTGSLLMLLFISGNFIDSNALIEAVKAVIENPTSDEAATNLVNIPGMQSFLILYAIIQALYTITFHAIKGATPGKQIMKIHVETADGEKLNWVTSTLRYISSLFTQFTCMFYGIGYLIVFVDPKRRALHDWIARTRVVFNKIKEKK